jgi:GntR family histidine utilization transcriptional repressor
VNEGSLHQRIRTEIEQKILSGDWGPGYRIPYEHELMEQYGCSRMTVNKAISALADAGLIDRRRRAGSFVARPRIHSAVLSIPDIKAEVTGRGEAYAFRIVSNVRRAAKRGDAIEKVLAGEKPLLAIVCLHLANGHPFAFEQRLISLAAVPEAEDADFTEVSPGGWLLTHVPWTEAEHRITAVSADADLAAALHIDVGSACLAVERRTWRGDEHVTYVKQTFAGDAYDLVAKFGPGR